LNERRLTAEELLKNYPAWWKWAKRLGEEAAEQAAWEGYLCEHIAKKNTGWIGDPVFRRAMRLVEANEICRAVEETRRFIDSLEQEEEQRVLIATWRMSGFGSDWISRSAGLSVARTMAVWTEMVARLERRLRDAGCSLLELRKERV
jgi:glutathione S-transferase